MPKEFIGSVGVLIVLLVICWPAGLIYFFMKYEEVHSPYMPMYGMPPPYYAAPPPGAYPPPGHYPPPGQHPPQQVPPQQHR